MFCYTDPKYSKDTSDFERLFYVDDGVQMVQVSGFDSTVKGIATAAQTDDRTVRPIRRKKRPKAHVALRR